MPILIIAGDYRKLEALRNELVVREYFEGVLNAQIIEVPDLIRYERWHDFLYHLNYLVKHYIPEKLPLE